MPCRFSRPWVWSPSILHYSEHKSKSSIYRCVPDGLSWRASVEAIILASENRGIGQNFWHYLTLTASGNADFQSNQMKPILLWTTFSSVQSVSHVWLCDPMNCSTPGLAVHHHLPEFTQTHVHWVNNAIQPLTSPYFPALFPSIRVFSNESALGIRWPKYWSFIFNISPSNEHPGLISFGMDCLHLLAVQGTLKSLLQHQNSKASILPCSAFFIVQLSHPYMTTGKTIALTRQTFVDKVMSLLFNMLSRSVITFLPRSKHLLISWLQSPSAVILEPQKNKVSQFPLFPHLFAIVRFYNSIASGLNYLKKKQKQKQKTCFLNF